MRKIFDFKLPKDLIAQYPLKEREKAKLLVVHRDKMELIEDIFYNIGKYFCKGDVLVLNDSRVIHARLRGVKSTGGRIEIFLLKKLGNKIWEVLLRGKIKIGQVIYIKHLIAKPLMKNESGSYIMEFTTDNDQDLFEIGEIPLPPYIKRKVIEEDTHFYQTVYAKKNGSIAAPTAGLHFTESLLKSLSEKGVSITFITLHIGWASFRMIKSETVKVEEEFIELSDETAQIINLARKKGNKIIAVGTSVVRTLESCFSQGKIQAKTGYTNLFIDPGFKFNVVDRLVTNFHLPQSTHLNIVCALAGVCLIEKAYKLAIENKYRFYSYGDAMLII